MELIVNLLPLAEEQRTAFARAAGQYEQVFAPEGRLEDGTLLSRDCYRRASIILGNPPVDCLKGNRSLRLLQTRSAGVDQYARPGVLPEGAVLCQLMKT